MNLKFKPDWEQTKDNFRQWWAHEYFGRCAIAIYAPKADIAPEPPPPLPAKVEDRWLDFEYLAAKNDYRFRHTFYGGEAFPIWNPGYPGNDGQAAFLGCPVTLAEETGWKDPIIGAGDLTDYEYQKMVIDPENRWWKFAHEVRRLAARESKGKSIPSSLTVGGSGDTLAALRSTNQLLFDVLDCPEYVKDFNLHLMKQFTEVYDELHQITRDAAEGSAGWFSLWSPGKFYAAQCDFAYMISPKMFIDIFLPAIEMQTRYLDHTIHHVDGVGNFAHVDALLDLPRLQALQILPGDGKPSPLYYMDVLRKVQVAGKNLHISIQSDEVETALKELSARGLFISTSCGSEEEAQSLLQSVEKWSVDRG